MQSVSGQRVFGESRVQELAQKVPALPADIAWHFIGHLQTNKVRQLLRLRPALIESVDTPRLLEIIDAEAEAQGIVQRVLMQLHVAREETKFGFTPDELLDWFAGGNYQQLKATHICGVMGMASNTDNTARIEADFRAIADTATEITRRCPDLRGFDTVSMGMSLRLDYGKGRHSHLRRQMLTSYTDIGIDNCSDIDIDKKNYTASESFFAWCGFYC